MENITAKLSYLQGLMDGLDLDKDSKEAKIFGAIAEVLEEMNDAIDDLYDYQDEMSVLIDDDFDDCDCDDCCDCDCDDDFEYELDCPNCGETLVFGEDCFDEDELICPNCKEAIELDFDCDCDCCDHDEE